MKRRVGNEVRDMPAYSRWRRWGAYVLGMVIESAAVGAICLAALGLMYLVKVLAR